MVGHSQPGKIQQATHAGLLDLGSIPIDCYVLEDGTRVLSQRGMQRAIGLSSGGGGTGAHRVAVSVSRMIEKASARDVFPARTAKDAERMSTLVEKLRAPVLFTPPTQGRAAYGYEATVLADVCDAILFARDAGVLQHQQMHLPIMADLLIRGFAAVGIIALVDEATGYQESRERIALQKVFKKWIADRLQPWTRTFPDEFYTEMFRLRGWDYTTHGINRRPGAAAYYTNDLIYLRLAPGVLKTLRDLVERDPSGRPRHKLHQRLTPTHGHPALRDHLGKVVMLMRISPAWGTMMGHVNHVLPRFDANLDLFPDLYIPPPEEDA